ncbi:MAG: hypothetical protein GYA57_21895 [Myxococcales bacterium]|nr:hypothetical protein [Myxococcales bacterium]
MTGRPATGNLPAASGDTSRTVYFRVDFYGGSTLDCGDWTVTITGHTSVAAPTC